MDVDQQDILTTCEGFTNSFACRKDVDGSGLVLHTYIKRMLTEKKQTSPTIIHKQVNKFSSEFCDSCLK